MVDPCPGVPLNTERKHYLPVVLRTRPVPAMIIFFDIDHPRFNVTIRNRYNSFLHKLTSVTLVSTALRNMVVVLWRYEVLKDKESRESYDLDQRAEEIQRRYNERKNRRNKENEEKFNWSDTFPGTHARKVRNYSPFMLKVCLHVPSPCLLPCPSPLKFKILLMVTDRLTNRMGTEPILSIKGSVTIDIMLILNTLMK